jgi:hypothetical protein
MIVEISNQGIGIVRGKGNGKRIVEFSIGALTIHHSLSRLSSKGDNRIYFEINLINNSIQRTHQPPLWRNIRETDAADARNINS